MYGNTRSTRLGQNIIRYEFKTHREVGIRILTTIIILKNIYYYNNNPSQVNTALNWRVRHTAQNAPGFFSTDSSLRMMTSPTRDHAPFKILPPFPRMRVAVVLRRLKPSQPLGTASIGTAHAHKIKPLRYYTARYKKRWMGSFFF